MAALSDDELKAKTPEFKQRYKDGETLDQQGEGTDGQDGPQE